MKNEKMKKEGHQNARHPFEIVGPTDHAFRISSGGAGQMSMA
jgi:hypothetical protein